jgi:hypothetical protein
MKRARQTTRSRHQWVPVAEGLESRKLLYATLGGQWSQAIRVTYSFAPDGTDVGGTPSQLNAAMAARGFSQADWQNQFRRAAALWQSVAGVNMVEVSDDGSPYSVAGNQQNDPRFGDIRIAGIGMSGSTLGLAFLPPAFNGGTLAGDIVMNTSQVWNINSHYDIQTVAIHEFGHSLGLAHSNITTAVMYAAYNGIKQSLHSDDIAGMQWVYGPRPVDWFDAASSNQNYTTASNINGYIDSNQQVTIPGLEITTTSDQDWYVVTVPANATGVATFRMQSSGLSSLSPRIQILDTRLVTVGLAAASANAYGATVSVSVGGVLPGQTYYVRAMSSTSGPNGVGRYGLQVNFGSGVLNPIAPPDTTVPEKPSQGGGSIAITEALEGLLSPATLNSIRNRLRLTTEPAELVELGTISGYGELLQLGSGHGHQHDGPAGHGWAGGGVKNDAAAWSVWLEAHDRAMEECVQETTASPRARKRLA